jgi:membrane protein DedA with SNARE-associated domain
VPSTYFILWLKESIGLYLLTFVHEDAAILTAGYSNVEHGLPLFFTYLPVYLGLVSGDLIIYGLGRAAQTNTWLRSKIIGPKVERVKSWLENNLLRTLILCRFTPIGLLFPTFVACGFFKISFRRFASISLIVGAFYSSLFLTVIILFGDIVLTHLGIWAWLIVALVLIGFAIWNYYKSRKRMIKEKPTNDYSPFSQTSKRFISSDKQKFNGMPSTKDLKKMVSPAEGVPNRYLYIPVILRWILLGARYRSITLPSVSNPMIETGGFMGESKGSVMDQVGKDQRLWLADYVYFQLESEDSLSELQKATTLMEEKGFSFPIVAKPDIGSNGYGVNLLEDPGHLLKYIVSFPRDAKMILQKPVNYDGEAGIFYTRYPGEPNGQIYSITLRYFPFVKGDGKSTLSQLIKNDPRAGMRTRFYFGERSDHVGYSKEELEHIPSDGELIRLSFIGSLRTGGLYRDGSYLVTPELTDRFDTIAKSMPEFYYGRFDIRFESIDLLKEGKGFSIIEINGAGAEAIHAWDPNVSFFKLYGEFFRAQSLLFKISALNRTRGFKPISAFEFIKAIRKQKLLIRKYPPSG